MSNKLGSNIRRSVLGLVALGLITGCTTVGEGTGIDYALPPFLDEAGMGDAIGDTLPGQYLAGRQALRERDTNSAFKYFDKAYALDSQDTYLLQNAFGAALGDGDMDVALELARELEKRDEMDDTIGLVLALDALRSKKYDEVQKRLGDLRLQGINILLKPVLTAWTDIAQGKPELAVGQLDGLDNYEGFKLLKSYHLALIAHAAGNDDLAERQYQLALKGPAGQAVRLVQSYGIFLIEQGKRDAAIKLFTNYQTRYPASPTMSALLETLEGGGTIKPLIDNPIEGAAEALYSSAAIIGQERANGTSITLSYFALMLRPELPVAYVLLAEIAEDQDQYEKAHLFYSKVAATSPYYRNAQIRKSWLAYKLGQDQEAISALKALAAQNPKEAEPLVVLADIYRDRQEWQQAAEAYGQAISNLEEGAPRLWSLLYARGIAYERMKAWNEAEADLVKAMELRPNHPQILNYLGYSWVDRGENLEEAKELLIKAVSLRPRDGYIVDSLGWLYYRIGDFENAVLQLENAVSLQAADPTINDHLGDAYWRVGRFGEARYQWQRALWLDPEEELIPIIREKLQNGLPPEVPRKE